jgi:hypothetical protein
MAQSMRAVLQYSLRNSLQGPCWQAWEQKHRSTMQLCCSGCRHRQ